MLLLTVTIPIITSVVTFIVYALLGHTITPAVAFTVVSLFQIVRNPFGQIPQTLTMYAQCTIALTRLAELLELPAANSLGSPELLQDGPTGERDEFGVLRETRVSEDEDEDSSVMLSVRRCSFSWGGEWMLKDLDLQVKRGSLVAVVGAVGSGKSSLLSALLGHMPRLRGKLVWRLQGAKPAFVSQEPFLISDSVRENILLGQPYERARFEEVVRVCCLEDDLAQLASGEWTEVGERGVTVSGGQRTRIGLARAVYRHAPAVLMDDPLSAVDSHVGQALMTEAIVGYLGGYGATRMLVTNQLALLREAAVDQIVVLDGGRMVESGSFARLSGDGGLFAKMLRAVGKQRESGTTPSGSRATESGQLSATPRSSQGASGKKAAGEEQTQQGAVSRATFLAYAHAGAGGSWPAFALLMFGFCLAEACFVTIDSWLAVWSDDRLHWSSGGYIAVYACLTVFYFVVTLVRSIGVARFGVSSSRSLYAAMQERVLYCPMRLFDTVPTGRLLNRFTKDISDVDDTLVGSFCWAIMSMLRVVSICVVITGIQPMFLLGLVFVFRMYAKRRQLYRGAARELQRIESVSRSPLYSHFAETIEGAATIAAHGDAALFSERFRAHLRRNLRAFYAQSVTGSWFSLQLQLLGACLVGACALSMVLSMGGVSAGLVGLALSYSNNIVINLNGMMFDWVRAETRMVGVERILEYSNDLPQEAHAPSSGSVATSKPPSDWPRFGTVEFDSVRMRYDRALPLVLKGVSFSVEAGQLVGVVGRTGSGKSSLFSALFRMVDLDAGSIIIDGVEISTLGLSTLRPRLAVIPQEPIIFAGTVRSNIDMYGKATTEQVAAAIAAAALQNVASSLPGGKEDGGLSGVVESKGLNLSVGERQLLCLARAHLRSSKLLLLDEATASVDTVTDGRIQRTIRNDAQFASATRIIIAHRLQTIIDADRVLVMDAGSVAEFGKPRDLLAKAPAIGEGTPGTARDGMFAALTKDSGLDLRAAWDAAAAGFYGRPQPLE
eukprot:COSAG04_NODE_97_length_26459_cov_6.507246_5_plen_1008_part_00